MMVPVRQWPAYCDQWYDISPGRAVILDIRGFGIPPKATKASHLFPHSRYLVTKALGIACGVAVMPSWTSSVPFSVIA